MTCILTSIGMPVSVAFIYVTAISSAAAGSTPIREHDRRNGKGAGACKFGLSMNRQVIQQENQRGGGLAT